MSVQRARPDAAVNACMTAVVQPAALQAYTRQPGGMHADWWEMAPLVCLCLHLDEPAKVSRLEAWRVPDLSMLVRRGRTATPAPATRQPGPICCRLRGRLRLRGRRACQQRTPAAAPQRQRQRCSWPWAFSAAARCCGRAWGRCRPVCAATWCKGTDRHKSDPGLAGWAKHCAGQPSGKRCVLRLPACFCCTAVLVQLPLGTGHWPLGMQWLADCMLRMLTWRWLGMVHVICPAPSSASVPSRCH